MLQSFLLESNQSRAGEMGRFKHGNSDITHSSRRKNPKSKNINQEVLLQIPGCTVYLMDEGEALEIATGEFKIVRISDNGVAVATTVSIGDDLQWPITKDEPVLKLDSVHYLFSLPMKDGDPLSYGVTFPGQYAGSLSWLDSFLSEHSCFSDGASTRTRSIDWKLFAPNVEDYNNVLAKAIAGGTGQLVKGIFICSNAYSSLVHNGAKMVLGRATEQNNSVRAIESNSRKGSEATKKSGMNESLKRVRNLSKTTENLSKAMLDGVGVATGSVMAPLVNSQAGKAVLSTLPGEVLLASLDAVNKILDAAETAEKEAISATSSATARIVSDRFGESAGEATEDVFATAGHCASTAWNIVKIRKAIYPSSTVSTGILKNAGKEIK